MKLRIRIILLFFIVFSALFVFNRDCLRIYFSKVPSILTENQASDENYILFVHDAETLCITCYTGIYFKKAALEKKPVIILPKSFSKNDIERLKIEYEIQNTIIQKDDKIIKYFDRIYTCKRIGKKNLLVQMTKNKISRVLTF